MALAAGDQIGPYEILAPLGAGGMGEVYRARDTKLDRQVAIKVLPAALAQDTERLARFEREAKVLASLNHPNIAQIYGIEQSALVMELVIGKPLAGPVPATTALDYARQIADALQAAHEKGIVHRDLKPANIMITTAGTVKVLDFGLAKSAEPAAASGDPANSPTLTISPTRLGTILGTASYMSPEQARGVAVDHRADIWAFGVVLYEMLTGRQLFGGETVSDILAGVLAKEPDLGDVPAQARRLLESCLQKDPRHRLQAIGDWRLALERTPAVSAPARKAPWLGAAVASLLAVTALGFAYFRRPPEETSVLKVSVMAPERAALNTISLPAVSPDGRRLVFAATTEGKDALWVRDLNSLAARRLEGTDEARDPFWSPDGRFIAFFAAGKLKKIDVAGGPALTLCDATAARGGSWTQDGGGSGTIVFAPDLRGGLFRVSAAGGAAAPLTAPDPASEENSHRWPWFLPDGHHFLYTARNNDVDKSGVYVGDLESKVRRKVLVANSNTVYSPPGYLLFLREKTLMAQPFDAGKLQVFGDPISIAERVDYVAVQMQGQFSASRNGVLAYTSGAVAGSRQLTWIDRAGRVSGTVGPPGGIAASARISPDGKTVVVARGDPESGSDVWLHEVERATAVRFTFTGYNTDPIWFPDGSRVAFVSVRNVARNLYQKNVGGAANDEVLDKDIAVASVDDWSPDGRYAIAEVFDPKTKVDLWALPFFGDRKPFPYLHSEFIEQSARQSPNGQFVAYVSDESKRNEVYVQTFPNPGAKWQISTEGGTAPVWSRDGKELFFVGANQKMMAVEVKADAKFEAGVPKPLFEIRGDIPGFDVSAAGRFLIPMPAEQAATVPLTVVVNWTAGLKR